MGPVGSHFYLNDQFSASKRPVSPQVSVQGFRLRAINNGGYVAVGQIYVLHTIAKKQVE